jgi:hypothetical protein
MATLDDAGKGAGPPEEQEQKQEVQQPGFKARWSSWYNENLRQPPYEVVPAQDTRPL